MREELKRTGRSTTMEIVRRNPVGAPFDQQRIERLVIDHFGAVYAARGADGATTVFEVIHHSENDEAAGFIVNNSLFETRVQTEESLRKARR